MTVGAELEIQLREQVGLRVVDLRGAPRAGVESVLRGQDLLDRIEARLRDPDARRVTVGSELYARRERTVVVAEVAGHEEVQPVVDDRAAQREAVLLLLVV